MHMYTPVHINMHYLVLSLALLCILNVYKCALRSFCRCAMHVYLCVGCVHTQVCYCYVSVGENGMHTVVRGQPWIWAPHFYFESLFVVCWCIYRTTSSKFPRGLQLLPPISL